MIIKNASESKKFSHKNEENQTGNQNGNAGLLIDFGASAQEENNNIKKNDTGFFTQLQYDNANNNKHLNQDVYNHNQQIFNNLNIDFGQDSDEENYGNINVNNNNNVNNNLNNNNNNNNFNPLDNNNNVIFKFFLFN